MMKHKESIIKFAKALAFCILLVCIIDVTSGIFEKKSSMRKNGAFFNENENMDVLILGDSHARDSIFPMELWNDYGITSYNFSGGHSTIALNYWILKNVISYSEPELVVLDCTMLSYNDKKVASLGLMHEQIDEIPLSANKMNMLYDLLDNWDDRLQFIWKFSLYHSRWSELTESDFKSRELIADKLNRGSTHQIKVAIPDTYPKLDKNDTLEEDTFGIEYLRKTIEECQKRNIDILLVYLPFPASEEKQREANTVYDIAAEYNVDYINFLDLDVVNYNTDCHDVNSHLNVCGGRKVTSFLGNYITKNYKITDHREDIAYIDWNNNYDNYKAYKISELKELQNLDSYLMMLSDKNLNACIYIDESVIALMDERMIELIANISQYESLEQLETAVASGKSYFLIVDNGLTDIVESVNGEFLDISNTSFGHLVFGTDEKGVPYLYIGDGEDNYLDGEYNVTAVAIDKYTGIIEDVALFTMYDKVHYATRAE